MKRKTDNLERMDGNKPSLLMKILVFLFTASLTVAIYYAVQYLIFG